MKINLNEATFGDAIKNYDSSVVYKEVGEYEDKFNADAVEVDANGDGKVEEKEINEIFEVLDDAMDTNIMILDDMQDTGDLPDAFSNVLIVGPAGAGKTAMVKRWAKSRGVRILNKSAMELDMGDLGGVVGIVDVDDSDMEKKYGKGNYRLAKQQRRAQRMSLDEFDELGEFVNGKYCVLFLDEFNRAAGAVRSSLLTLINNHVISDTSVPGGKRFLPAFLFTVAAVNPTSYSDNIEPFDPAELGRLRVKEIQYDVPDTLRYLGGVWENRIKRYEDKGNAKMLARAKGQYEILKRLLTHPAFHFATEQEENQSREDGPAGHAALSPRTLEMCLLTCNGTKDHFMKLYPEFCGNVQLPMIKQIMAGYKDIDVSSILNDRGTGTTLDNKANSVFKKKSATASALDKWAINN